jgi:Mg2+-importing ATPase
MGDGINDAPALHSTYVGISVDSAVDVAKETAEIVLIEKGLDVLVEGVREVRMTFANAILYYTGRDCGFLHCCSGDCEEDLL